jgi:hypothetical protein
MMKPVRMKVNDKMQKGYVYVRTKPMGRAFRSGFTPELTPKQMLELGVFGGKYMTDCQKEFPASWFKRAKLSPDQPRASLNYFGVNASQSLSEWRRKGWIHPEDPRAGSNGIADIIAGAAARMTYARSPVGARFVAMWRN